MPESLLSAIHLVLHRGMQGLQDRTHRKRDARQTNSAIRRHVRAWHTCPVRVDGIFVWLLSCIPAVEVAAGMRSLDPFLPKLLNSKCC